MTRLILFDLGDTLESGDVLRPGALETVRHVAEQPAALLGLLSDFTMTDDPAQVPAIRQQYLDILDGLGIREFFEPAAHPPVPRRSRRRSGSARSAR